MREQWKVIVTVPNGYVARLISKINRMVQVPGIRGVEKRFGRRHVNITVFEHEEK